MTGADPARALRLIAVVLAVGVAALLAPPARPVLAQDVELTSAEAADLARAAVDDDAARAQLIAVERVDGRPVQLGSVIAEDGAVRADRLQAVADELDEVSGRDGADGAASPGEARAQAESVLDDDKYQESDVPKPFKGLLEWLADRLRPVGDVLSRVFDPILDLPGGALILGGLFFAAAGLAIGWLVGRRSRAVLSGQDSSGPLVDRDADPEELEQRASDAETSGEHGDAVRLRYQAGLLRLVRSGLLTLRAETTAADAARQVDQEDLWVLTDDFEQIVYGERTAVAADVARSRHRWSALLTAQVDA